VICDYAHCTRTASSVITRTWPDGIGSERPYCLEHAGTVMNEQTAATLVERAIPKLPDSERTAADQAEIYRRAFSDTWLERPCPVCAVPSETEVIERDGRCYACQSARKEQSK
jgi:hypothetical protein